MNPFRPFAGNPAAQGGSLPPVVDTVALYSDDFAAYANGTQLTDVGVPADKRFTRTGATGSTPTVDAAGQLTGGAGVFTEVGTSFLYRDHASTNHWDEFTIGSTISGASAGMMLAATDFNDRIGIRFGTGSVALKEVVAGAASADLASVAFSSTARSKATKTPAVSVEDTLGVQVYGGKAYLFKNRIRIGLAAGYAINPTGTRFGWTNGNSPWSNTTKREAGPLLGKVTIGDSWRKGSGTQTAKSSRISFPRTQGLGGYANGACDITVPVTTQGTVTGFVFGLIDPETGKRIRLSGTQVWLRAESAVLTGGSTYDVTFRVPCGLRIFEDGSARLGAKPYLLSVAPENDTRGFDTHPNMFDVAYTVLCTGQSLIQQWFAGVTYVADHPGGTHYYLSYPTATEVVTVRNTAWATSTSEGTGDQNSGAFTEFLSKLLDLPVMLVNVAIPARNASALDPDNVSTEGTYIRNHMAFAGGAFDAIIVDQGQDEVHQLNVTNAAAWKAQWITNINHYLAYSGQPSGTVIPICFYITGKYNDPGVSSDVAANVLRKAQDDIIADLQGAGLTAFLGGNTVGVTRGDTVHLTNTAVGSGRHARRFALSLAKALSVNSYDGRGPLFGTPVRVGAVITIPVALNGADSLTVLNGQDGTDAAGTASALSGWHVADSYNSAAGTFSGDRTVGSGIASVVLTGSDVVITLASDPGHSVVIANCFGYNPDWSSWVVGLKTDATLGLTNWPIYAEPIIDPVTVA